MTREEAIKAIKSHCYFANLVTVGKEALDMAIEALEQEPCEDTISREQAVETVVNWYFDFLDGKEVEDVVNLLDALPSVQPTRKKGKWKLVQIGKRVDLCCANCGAVRVEEIAHNYTIDELNKFFKEDLKECLKHPDMSYCPCCGAEMESGE